ncbi:MAG: hypothetical protein ACREMN_14240 [Gemmatimonadales bacterium]
MRFLLFLTVAVLVACRGDAGSRDAQAADADSLAARPMPRDSADSVLLTPRFVQERTVLVFWLAAADTFAATDQAAVLDELTIATGRIAPTLARFGIRLVPTNADTVYLALPNRDRHVILLSGLEFPFGYVLIDPEGSERILSGVFGDAELLDEIRVYFDLPEQDSTVVIPRIST